MEDQNGLIIAVGIWFTPESGLGLRIGFGIGSMYGFMGMVFLPPAS